MKREALGKCPICGSNTEITRISCNECDTVIEGHFQLCRFCRLTAEQKTFIDVFIKCRGNIKEVERELGVSYPTVKNRLEDVATALGYKAEPVQPATGSRKGILDKLNNGEITVEDAINLMKE
jgi:hypothetical protein